MTLASRLDVSPKIHLDDAELQQTIYSMVARLIGGLAQIEHQQKLQLIRSGVRATQSAGKWTARQSPASTAGDFATIANDTGIAESMLRSLHQDRRDLYLGGEAEDKRIDDALTDVHPLEDARAEDPEFEELRERVERLEETTDFNNR
ncbi:hypothetical protein C464_16802 [Halorubrum coriense DSM 10284]|uniref:Uncharacterized protein n=2 Tax=Halorubrum coriense TaxID=64713 RepID=M0E6I0_9EURY|nr:hypothetical protein C464_16802 [Halorubrum coriense DSM 10284]